MTTLFYWFHMNLTAAHGMAFVKIAEMLSITGMAEERNSRKEEDTTYVRSPFELRPLF